MEFEACPAFLMCQGVGWDRVAGSILLASFGFLVACWICLTFFQVKKRFFFPFFCMFVSVHDSVCNDLWNYNISSQMWTWMAGSNQTNQIGVYGQKVDNQIGRFFPF